jgi:hypothetical protein
MQTGWERRTSLSQTCRLEATFTLSLQLPTELQLRILNSCDSAMLFQLMHVSYTTRDGLILARDMFFKATGYRLKGSLATHSRPWMRWPTWNMSKLNLNPKDRLCTMFGKTAYSRGSGATGRRFLADTSTLPPLRDNGSLGAARFH